MKLNTSSHREDHIYQCILSFVRCLDVGDMFGQDVNVSSGRRSMQYKDLSGTPSTVEST